MTQAEAGPAWAQGHDVERLRELTAVFKKHDKPFIYGAFGTPNEQACAQALSDGRLLQLPGYGEPPRVVAIAREVGQRQQLTDFSGAKRARMEPGDWVCKRIAWVEGAEEEAATLLAGLWTNASHPTLFGSNGGDGGRLWVELLRESPADMWLVGAVNARLSHTRIPASSELFGVYYVGSEPERSEAHPAERAGLSLLDHNLPIGPTLDVLYALALDYQAHYSSKQKAGAWSGLALRAYGPPGEPPSPLTIHKPSEMAQKWKRENAEQLTWELADTPLRAQLPQAEELLALVPGKHHRIRLLRLEPGGGELTRHADITDPDAGVQDGQVSRIHIPLRTHPRVQFSQWLLNGREQLAHMAAGDMWYLDTRKPHRARNNGPHERIHLVVDTESGPELRELLAQAWTWPA